MNENELTDDLLLENIEGLLFSEEYADSENNSSLISEITDAEIPAEENSSGDGEGAAETESAKNDSQKKDVKEDVLNIDYSEDTFEKGFDSFAVEKLSDSLKSNEGVRRLFMEKASVKDGLISNFPIWSYDESKQFSLASFMKDGFGATSLLDPVGTSKESVNPFVSEEKSKILAESIKGAALFANQENPNTPSRNVLRVEKSNKTTENSRDLKFSYVNTDVPKKSKDPEKINVFAKTERPKAPVRDVLLVEKSNKPIEKDKGLKFDSVNTEVPKVSKDPEKINVFAEAERPNAPVRDALHVEKPNQSVGKDNGLKFDSVNTEVSKVSKGSEKINVFAEPEKPKAPARDVFRVEKPNKSDEKDNGLKFDSVNTEVPKVSKGSEKINVFAEPEKPKAPARDFLLVEKPNKPIEKDNGLKFDSVKTDVPKISKDPEKINVFAEAERPKAPARDVLLVEKPNKSEEKDNGLKFDSINTETPKASKNTEKVNVFAEPEKQKAPARDLLSIEKSNKLVENSKETKCDSINKEISKASSVDSNKSMDSKKLEKVKPAPKKDFAEFKNDYKNIAANNAISITGDKSLCFTSSCSQKQDEMFFDVNDKVKRNSFDDKFFNEFRKDISRCTIPQRTSLTGRSSTKAIFDNAFEKKTRMSMFNERKTSAYNCMKNDFKHKKELF